MCPDHTLGEKSPSSVKDWRTATASAIHRKNDDGRPPDGGLANRIRAFPPEVSRPLVPSRIEQPGDPPREGIDPGDVRSLVSVIVEAGESKVLRDCRTAVRASDDMVDRERDRRVEGLGHPAIFAGVSRSLSHFSCQGCVHGSLRTTSPPSATSSPWSVTTRGGAQP